MASDLSRNLQRLRDRSVITLGGDAEEQLDFLQSLVTNDVSRASSSALVYAALLTPQGKYLSDFLVSRDMDGNFLLDVATGQVVDLVKRLTMYRLRRPITISHAPCIITAVWGRNPGTGYRDPRHPELGWRIYGDEAEIEGTEGDYDLYRLSLGIPESGIDLIVNDTYVLEAGFEDLSGVDFRKGCYVGQEIVARMKHKTDLRKGLVRVTIDGSAPPMTPLLTNDGKPAGTLHSNRDGIGLAHLRFERAGAILRDSEERVSVSTTMKKDNTL